MIDDYWVKNNIKKPDQHIVCAANKIGDVLLVGARHCDKLMREQARARGLNINLSEQGFIDQFGDFVTREDAFNIMIKNNQNINLERNRSSEILYSEGLY